MWHLRYGHLTKDDLINGFDYDVSKETGFCESCAEGKQHRNPFPTSGIKRVNEPLRLVHSDVCGKLNEKSLSGGKYFVTFINDHTYYV